MTAFERFEREIPSLMDEIAPPRLPDYFDDMLRQTGRTRQRPAWASLERWLPMDVVARPVSVRAPALRPLLILLLIGLLIAGGLVLYAGSQRTRLPEPFGLARNGVIVISTTDRRHRRLRPGVRHNHDVDRRRHEGHRALVLPDGQRFMFVRLRFRASMEPTGSPTPTGRMPASSCGRRSNGFDWSDAGDRIVDDPPPRRSGPRRRRDRCRQRGGRRCSTSAGRSSTRTGGPATTRSYSRPPRRHSDQSSYYLVNADGTEPHLIEGVSTDTP